MKIHERAQFLFEAEYSGKTGCGPRVPENQTVLFESMFFKIKILFLIYFSYFSRGYIRA